MKDLNLNIQNFIKHAKILAEIGKDCYIGLNGTYEEFLEYNSTVSLYLRLNKGIANYDSIKFILNKSLFYFVITDIEFHFYDDSNAKTDMYCIYSVIKMDIEKELAFDIIHDYFDKKCRIGTDENNTYIIRQNL